MKNQLLRSLMTFTLSLFLLGTSSFADTVSVKNDNVQSNGTVTSDENNIAQDVINTSIYVDGILLDLDVTPVTIDGVTMVPVKKVLDALDYTVTWDPTYEIVEIYRGAQWTSLTIDSNNYTFAKMSPFALSAPPVLVSGRTLVPAEFFSAVLGIDMRVENGDFYIMSNDSATALTPSIKDGFIKNITYDETGMATVTLTSDLSSDDMGDLTILHTSDAFTIFNTDLEEGKFIKVLTAPIMTLSLPSQTSAYIIY